MWTERYEKANGDGCNWSGSNIEQQTDQLWLNTRLLVPLPVHCKSYENVSFVDTAADRHLQHCVSACFNCYSCLNASIVFVYRKHEAPAVTVKTMGSYARKNRGS